MKVTALESRLTERQVIPSVATRVLHIHRYFPNTAYLYMLFVLT